MIDQEVVEAYNRRLTVDLSNIKDLTASQRDAVKNYGSLAEALIKNRRWFGIQRPVPNGGEKFKFHFRF